MKGLPSYLRLAVLTLAIAGCFAQAAGSLRTGMTLDEAVVAMGPPDLKGSVPDPNQSGAVVLRYTWLSAGKSAVFGTDGRVASVADISPPPASTAPTASAAAQTAMAQPEQVEPSRFDPVSTPFDYLFYPVRAALIYLGAGANCLGGGECRLPKLPSPSQG